MPASGTGVGGKGCARPPNGEGESIPAKSLPAESTYLLSVGPSPRWVPLMHSVVSLFPRVFQPSPISNLIGGVANG